MRSNLELCDRDKIGFYILHNANTDETYVGSGILGRREKSHSLYLESGKTGRKDPRGEPIRHHNHRLQRAYNRDSNFDFVGIPTDDFDSKEENRQTALIIEQSLINESWGNPLLLNLVKEVEAPMMGRKHSAETKEKMRQSMFGKNVGKKMSAEVIKRISAFNTGRKDTIESKENKRQAQLLRHRENPYSKEIRDKIAKSNTGKTRSDEARERMRLSHVGIPNTEEQKRKISASLTGIKRSPETIAKMRIAAKKRMEIRGLNK